MGIPDGHLILVSVAVVTHGKDDDLFTRRRRNLGGRGSVETGPLGTYVASWHLDWTVGAVLHGGCVAGVIHHVETHLASDSAFKARNQPDVVNLHFEFLRPCVRRDSVITVTTVRMGSALSTLQLQLERDGQVRALALATAGNLDKVLGPSVSTAPIRTSHPPPDPAPDFDGVLAHKRDDHWIAARVSGEIIPFSRFGDRIDATYVAMMTDMIPSLSDTLLRNRGLYDAHDVQRKSREWAERNPGVPAEIMNTAAEAMKSPTFNSTQTLDIEFTKKVPRVGLRFVFTRTAANVLREGRMSIDITICNKNVELVYTAHQLIIVLERERKFRTAAPKAAM
ncbi:thioesterase-like superfamily-domain-containing protein [Nemania sp. NC0429]|nr:thioesterase-like superfamily-domain-containing protein [Nemania sp. NC0429]